MRARLFVLLVALFSAAGCSRPADMSGIVTATKEALDASRIEETRRSLVDDETPLTGVEVYLAFDEEGAAPIAGTTLTTGPDGAYRIVVDHLPKRVRDQGFFYIVAKKLGYYDLSRRIYLGSRGAERQSVIILTKNEGDGEVAK